MQDTPVLGKPLILKLFVLHCNCKAVRFWVDSVMAPFELTNKHVFYEFLTQDGKTVHTQRNHLIPYYAKEVLLFPHIQSFKFCNKSWFWNIRPNSKSFTYFYWIVRFRRQSYPFWNDYGVTKIMFANKMFEMVNLDDCHNPFR